MTGPFRGFAPCTDAIRQRVDPWNKTWRPHHGTHCRDREKMFEAALILPGWEWKVKVMGMG